MREEKGKADRPTYDPPPPPPPEDCPIYCVSDPSGDRWVFLAVGLVIAIVVAGAAIAGVVSCLLR